MSSASETCVTLFKYLSIYTDLRDFVVYGTAYNNDFLMQQFDSIGVNFLAKAINITPSWIILHHL